MFVEAGELIDQGKDDAIVKGGRKPFVERGWMATIRREREDASAREGGCQRKRGRMPAQEREDASAREGECQHERQDASAREAGCQHERGCRPFIERGRMLAVHREREVAIR